MELVVALYDRVFDLHNFDLVMRTLSPREAACVYCRLGILNVFNPCKPEGSVALDLSRHEERVVAKMMVRMSNNCSYLFYF